MEWAHAHRKQLTIGAVVVAVAGLAWAVVSWKKAQDETDANQQFFAVPTQRAVAGGATPTGPLLAVAKDYPNTPSGEHARLMAAEDMFVAGQYPEASQQFAEFLSTYPDSGLIAQAKVGLAACLEGEGKTADAISKYHEIVLAYPTEANIVSPAKLTLARLYEDDNKPQEALSYYAELARMLRQNPYDPWASEAQERAALLVAKHPELLKVLNSAAAAPGPAGLSIPETVNPTVRPQASGPAPASAPKAAPANNASGLMNFQGISTNKTGKP
ncbi:MAG TPA: tetratricopeptide repeat protein [Verrucomicrobiae bacterium]